MKMFENAAPELFTGKPTRSGNPTSELAYVRANDGTLFMYDVNDYESYRNAMTAAREYNDGL